jgi:Predicted ATP-binding protein involved in virulence
MLKEFAIYGLFKEYDYNVTLSSEHVTFIHSLNGFGKSTVMRLIADVLAGDVEGMNSIMFDRIDLTFNNENCLIVEKSPDGLLIQMQKNGLEEELSEKELKDVLNTLLIPSDRTVINADGELISALGMYLSELTDTMRDVAEKTKLEIPGEKNSKKYSDDELEFHSKDLKAKLDFMKQAGFEPEMPSGYRFPPSRFEIAEYRKDYIDLVRSLDDYVDRFYNIAESVIVFMDVINDVFINKEIYVNEKNILNVKMSNGTALPINRLSSGEKQMIIMTYLLLFRAKRNSLVIIDEPEISLHVAWQQKLGKTFKDIARLRNLQILVATHSPQIIHDDWDNSVELKVEND